MIVVGGQAPKAIRSVERYDFEEDRWDQIAELPSRRCRAGEQPTPPSAACLFPARLSVTSATVPCSSDIYIRLSSSPYPSCLISGCPFWGQFLCLYAHEADPSICLSRTLDEQI